MKIPHPSLIGAVALGLLLGACASSSKNLPPFPADALPPPTLLAGGDWAGIATARVVLQFKPGAQAYDGDKFVTTLQVQAQVPMYYIAAVSADTHVYGLELSPTHSATAAVQRLKTLPLVLGAEVDEQAKAK